MMNRSRMAILGFALALIVSGPIWAKNIHEEAKAGNLAQVKVKLAFNPGLLEAKDEEGDTPLHIAAQQGHMELIQFLTAKGANVNARDDDGGTPLHKAVIASHDDVVEFLLSKGAKVNARNEMERTALHDASKQGDQKIAELLINKKADVNARDKNGTTPLHEASWNGHGDMVELLLNHQAVVNIKDNQDIIPLHLVCDKSIGELLISRGADVKALDTEGNTPLHYASRHGCKDEARLLLSHGAKVNARNNDNDSPLHLFSHYWGDIDLLAQLLIQNGADVNAVNNKGDTPLNMAILRMADKKIIELLVSSLTANAKNELGNTPLHLAAKVAHKDAVIILLAHGADVNARNKSGDTPLHLLIIEAESRFRPWSMETSWGFGSGRNEIYGNIYSIPHGFSIDNDSSGVTVGNACIRPGVHSEYYIGDPRIGFSIVISEGPCRSYRYSPEHREADPQKKAEYSYNELKNLLKKQTINDYEEVLNLLITGGAEVNLRNDKGETPLKLASVPYLKELAEVLRQHGGRVE